MNTRPQESVADYPRPPAIEHVDRAIHASVRGHVVIDTHRPIRILETFHPPVYYVPPADVSMQFLEPSPHTSFCEYKGQAHYYSLVVDGEKRSNVAGTIPTRRRATRTSRITSPSTRGRSTRPPSMASRSLRSRVTSTVAG